MATQIYKPVTSTISTRQETSALKVITGGSGLTYSLCDRISLTEKNTNYFVSFNLPVSYSALPSGSTLALSNPEIFQINVDKVVVVPIPREYYSEIIDGRSITFTVPQVDGMTMSSKTIVSSTYTTLQKKQTNAFLGNNLSFLFCDEINRPYTGTTGGNSHSANTTWNTPSYSNRPAAVPYSILVPATDVNTDQRPFSAQNQAITVTPTYPTNTNQGYNYDIPVGFACLDKGFMVLTHPKIVNNIPWSQGFEEITNAANSLSGTSNIYFNTNSSINFIDININYITAVVCIALPAEFFFTNNPSWDLIKNAQEFNNNTNNYDPLYITEIGLYNLKNELIAIAKTSEPVLKGYTDIINFSLEIDV
jgi:hypothetical protein